MTTAQALHLLDLRSVTPMSLPAFFQRCADGLHAGDRLITLFGRREKNRHACGTVVTAVLQPTSGQLIVLRGQAEDGQRYPSLTASYPGAQIFERELWEQTGLCPDAHPWLKPVRFEGERQQRMTDYPFFKVRGREVHEVGVGPIHAGVIEPGHFRFMCLGEKVHHLEIQLGYQHRGVEALLLRRPPMLLASTVESICGDSSVAYAWGYCAAVEALSGAPVGLETDLLRGIALEMERVAMHVATLNGLATDVAFLQGGGTYGRLRTAIINATQRVCGNRFGRGWLRPGRTRGLTEALRQDLIQTLTAFAKDFTEVGELMLSSLGVKARFQGVGTVGAKAARELGLVGVVARASGVAIDARVQWPGRVYEHFPAELTTESAGDCWARMKLRMREVDASVSWLLKILLDSTLDLREAKPAVASMDKPLAPETLCISLIEGTRGPVVQVLETSPQGQLLHYKVQDPSLPNWFGLAMALRDNEISDFPICNKSFDLSYCGNDL
ncbi:MAG: NADH-quinone oxidoreductase subunit C [Rhodocyclaceae bacterium]